VNVIKSYKQKSYGRQLKTVAQNIQMYLIVLLRIDGLLCAQHCVLG